MSLQVTNLIGFGGGGEDAPLTMSFLSRAVTGSGSTPIMGAGAVIGDWACYIDWGNNSSGSPASVVPTDMTAWADPGSGGMSLNHTRMTISQGILTANNIDGILGNNGTFDDSKTILVFRPSRPLVGVLELTSVSNGSTGNPGANTISVNGLAGPAIVIGFAGTENSNTVWNPAPSPAFTQEWQGDGGWTRAGYTIYNDGITSNHTVDVADQGNANFSGVAAFRFS